MNMEDRCEHGGRLIDSNDSMKKSGCTAGDVPITKELRKSSKLSRSRVQLDLKKEEETKNEQGLKRKAKLDDLNDVKKAKIETMSCIEILKSNLATEGITKSTKATAFASQMLSEEETLKTLQETEKQLEKEYKDMEV